MSKLFKQGTLGDITVKNRVFMAPLTRNRAELDGTPNEIAIKYYAQRASAGLIIAEATQISPQGQGYIKTPGVYNDQHVNAWRKITDAVHAEGGKIIRNSGMWGGSVMSPFNLKEKHLSLHLPPGRVQRSSRQTVQRKHLHLAH